MQLEEQIAELSVDADTIRARIEGAMLRHNEELRELVGELRGLRLRIHNLHNLRSAARR
jgi:hypothetical protein